MLVTIAIATSGQRFAYELRNKFGNVEEGICSMIHNEMRKCDFLMIIFVH